MDWLTFISQLVKSLAWPIAVVVIAVVLREEVGRLLSKITRIRHNDTEVEFRHELAAAKKEAEKVLPDYKNTTYLKSQSSQLAKLSPRGAIIEAWLSIEGALLKYAERHGIEVKKDKPFTMRELHFHTLDYGSLGKGVFEMLGRLRRTRNEAVHLSDAQIDEDSAQEYVELASRVIQRIEEA
ncbi:hypothetical protein HUS23_02770 [Ectothiorhodospiraceae bacterium 2226]|nr:hypothetical protein HUS23_02770 [Ectothiorhodospiraceae bacterium 2226]